MDGAYAIETSDLTKIFRSRFRKREVRAVNGISLRVARGITFGFLGPNGAGKTTFVKMILSAVRPTSGRAKIFGLDARDPEARRPIGYLPENHRFPTYFTGTGMLDFYAALSGMDARSRKRLIPELLEQVGLDRWGDVRLGKYSKGMLQRVGLAQALIHSPSLLVLDEPTDGVDPVGRRHIREILSGLEAKGVTIFINSHLLSEVESFCREVAILSRGEVVLAGTVKNLTAGRGYRITATRGTDRLEDDLRKRAASFASRDGVMDLQFATREEANESIDLLRAEQCAIESVAPTVSTLEDVFVKAVEGRASKQGDQI